MSGASEEQVTEFAGATDLDADAIRRQTRRAIATFAEFEVDLLRLRTREGMAIARAKGKLRGRMMVPTELSKDAAEEYFKSSDAFKAIVGEGEIKKLIFVPGRLVNVIM